MHSIETLKNLLNSGASLRIDANNALILCAVIGYFDEISRTRCFYL